MRKLLQKLASSTSPDSLASKFRRKRFKFFLEILSAFSNGSATILDVGGWERFWEIQGFVNTNHKLIILNLNKVETHYPNIVSIIGDARDLSQFADKSVDIVFSNSVIEHLSTFENQAKMAGEVIRVGKKYYVQTPSYYFPLEPHFLFPFFHWLPIFIRVFLVRHFSLGWHTKSDSDAEALRSIHEIRLLTKSELKRLFPEAIIHTEKFLGLIKSYTAIKE
jgi:SAM-dependent methyltransferase